MSLFKKEDTPSGSPFAADTITLQAIEEARRAMKAQDAKLRQSMFDKIYTNQMPPEPEPAPPTEDECRHTAEILTEVVLLLHAGDWRAAQHKLQSRRLPGLPDVAVIDVSKKHISDRIQDAARYGRSISQAGPRPLEPTATAINAKHQAAQAQMSAMQRSLLDEIARMNTPPSILRDPFNTKT